MKGARARRWSLGAVACLALTCARPVRPDSADARRHVQPAEPSQPRPAPRPAVAKCAVGPLSAFFEDLRQLQDKKRQQHVRVLWLGDSHTAADYLSGAVRSALGDRFGDGGAGFVRIGTRPYRHDGLKVVRDGAWNVDPDPPARRAPQDDGNFGFAGTRAVPGAGASFSVELSARSAPAGDARFELSYALPPGASFDVQLGQQRLTVSSKTPAELSPSGISHLSLTAPLASHLTLLPRTGAPRLFGLVIERAAAPGLVLDTAGIDGARLETPLAWNEAAFTAEVARRAPSLFVIAYGTNEAFDRLRVDKYGGQLAQLVRRLRAAAPGASCLVLGPTDAPLGTGSVPRVAEVAQALAQAAAPLGCAFVSLQRLMGGEGSFALGMAAKPRLAQPDRLHLTPQGYQALGGALAKLLLEAYSAGLADVAPATAGAPTAPAAVAGAPLHAE